MGLQIFAPRIFFPKTIITDKIFFDDLSRCRCFSLIYFVELIKFANILARHSLKLKSFSADLNNLSRLSSKMSWVSSFSLKKPKLALLVCAHLVQKHVSALVKNVQHLLKQFFYLSYRHLPTASSK